MMRGAHPISSVLGIVLTTGATNFSVILGVITMRNFYCESVFFVASDVNFGEHFVCLIMFCLLL